MRASFGLDVSVSRMRQSGRVLIYVALTLCNLRFYVQRWDNERSAGNILRTRNGMGWIAGINHGADRLVTIARLPVNGIIQEVR